MRERGNERVISMLSQPMSDSELDRLREETPAWGRYAHFAHGSISLPPQAVFDAMQRWQQLESQQGAHRAIVMLREELDQVRVVAAQLLNADAHQIAFLDSASRSWALALAAACDNVKRVEVITTEHEWGGNAINLLHASQRERIGLHVLSPKHGNDEPLLSQIGKKLTALADSATRLVVSLPTVAMTDGSLIELRGVAAQVHNHDGLLFVDASHAVGQIPVDVTAMGCDVLVFPARKWLRGPKGISVLYLSDRALTRLGAPPTLDIASAVWDGDSSCRYRDDARRFEMYEYHPGLRLGFVAAANYAMKQGLERIALQNMAVREHLRWRLAHELDLHAVGDSGSSVFLTYRLNKLSDNNEYDENGRNDITADQLMRTLEDKGINASLVGKQYARWAMTSRGMTKLLRLTPHYITSETETEHLLSQLRGLRALLV